MDDRSLVVLGVLSTEGEPNSDDLVGALARGSIWVRLMEEAAMLSPGTEAPDFTARTTEGRLLSLRDLRGGWVVLYFFPKAFTAG